MNRTIENLRYAFRRLRQNPGFTAVALITLALGIGASAAIFSVVYSVLLRPLPYEKPDQIVRLWESNPERPQMNFADPNFEDVQTQSQSFQALAEFGSDTESVLAGSTPARVPVSWASENFFSVMRVQPAVGREFTKQEHRFGAAPTAMVGYGFWKEFLGGTHDLSGVKLTILSRPVSVVGVLPPQFDFPEHAQVWIPRGVFGRPPSRTAHNWRVIGRLRDGVALSQARAELATIGHRLKEQYGRDIDLTDIAVLQLHDELASPVRPALIVLFGAVGFLLLVACMNVANLLLAQGAARQKELAIRIAIGASRSQLITQFVFETLLLSAIGGVLGFVLARTCLAMLLKLAPAELTRIGDISVKLPAMAFALATSLIAAIALGVFSALRSLSSPPQSGLIEGGRSQTGTGSSKHLGRAIVIGQLAITLTLLTGAGLLGRSLLRVLSVDPGFRTEHVLTMDLSLPFVDEKEKTQRAQFLAELLDRLRAAPGVIEVGGTAALPLSEGPADGGYIALAPGQQPPHTIEEYENLLHTSPHVGYANYCPASAGFFRALRIPLLQGRLFNEGDTMDAPQVALISESLARERWPNQDALGQTLEFGNMDGDFRPLTVVGVVGDVRADSLETVPAPTVYVFYRQRPQAAHDFTVVLRAAGEPTALISSAREVLRILDPTVPPQFGTFVGVVSASLQARRFNLELVGVFAGAALLLAVVGLYGVMAYSVTRRTGEIGVRLALGATRANILGLILSQGLRAALIGVGVGIACSFALSYTIRALLFGLSPADPLTLIGVSFLLVFVALLACWLPARRAARVDPMVALRYE